MLHFSHVIDKKNLEIDLLYYQINLNLNCR